MQPPRGAPADPLGLSELWREHALRALCHNYHHHSASSVFSTCASSCASCASYHRAARLAAALRSSRAAHTHCRDAHCAACRLRRGLAAFGRARADKLRAAGAAEEAALVDAVVGELAEEEHADAGSVC